MCSGGHHAENSSCRGNRTLGYRVSEKYWPPIENAIRDRAKDRQARIADAAKRMAERRGDSVVEVLRNRDPVDFMRRRADALERRGADLKRLADTRLAAALSDP